MLLWGGIPICVMSVVLAFFYSLIFSRSFRSRFKPLLLCTHHHRHHRSPIHSSRTPSILVEKFSIQHIIPSVTIKYLHVWAKRVVCVWRTHTHTHCFRIKCEHSRNTKSKNREWKQKRIMPACVCVCKWDREKLKIYWCQKWRQAYKTKLTETDARTKKSSLTCASTKAIETTSNCVRVRVCVRATQTASQICRKNNFLFFRVLSSLGICNDVLTT